MPIRIVLADDHPIVLDGLEQLFRATGELGVVARCSNGEEALSAAERYKPDILVLDFRMPRMNGLEVLRAINTLKLKSRVVLLTAELDEEEMMEAIRLGVGGVVLKEMASRVLLQCIRKVHEGGQWLESSSVGKALETMLRRESSAQEHAAILTPRELEIARMVARGLRNKEIANQLSISEGTVKIHLHSVYEKLQLGSRLELSIYAREKRLI